MAELMLVDNDVLLKASCYDLAADLLALLSGGGRNVAGLALAKFVLKRKVAKSSRIADRQRATKALDALLGSIEALEPDTSELQLAAQYEEHALGAGYAFDSGESQLLAVLVNRAAKALATGDKRAVSAAWQLATDLEILPKLEGRFICFEQIMLEICVKKNASRVAESVCAEKIVDKTMSICFGCASEFDEAGMRTGLLSYADDLRKRSGALVCDSFPS